MSEKKYRVWFVPYGYDYEEDYIDVEMDREEAIRFARTVGRVREVEEL